MKALRHIVLSPGTRPAAVHRLVIIFQVKGFARQCRALSNLHSQSPTLQDRLRTCFMELSNQLSTNCSPLQIQPGRVSGRRFAAPCPKRCGAPPESRSGRPSSGDGCRAHQQAPSVRPCNSVGTRLRLSCKSPSLPSWAMRHVVGGASLPKGASLSGYVLSWFWLP